MSLKNIVTVVFRLERNKLVCHQCSSDSKYSTCVTLKWYIYSLTMKFFFLMHWEKCGFVVHLWPRCLLKLLHTHIAS